MQKDFKCNQRKHEYFVITSIMWNFLYPLERAKDLVTCEIAYKGKDLRYRNCFTCLGKIFDVEGIGGLYKGFTLSFLHFSTAVLFHIS